jgi:serine/threonine protein kinase
MEGDHSTVDESSNMTRRHVENSNRSISDY